MAPPVNAWLALRSMRPFPRLGARVSPRVAPRVAPRVGTAVVLALSLMGCASLRTSDEANLAAPHSPANYVVSGKAKVSAPDLAQNLRFRWQQQDGEYDIWLWGALGMGRTQLKGNEANFIMTQGNQQLSGSATELMQAHFGWSVPVGALSAWLRGVTAPNMPVANKRVDALRRLIAMQQRDWNVAFADHQLVNNVWLPGRVSIRGQQVDLEVVLLWPQPVMAIDASSIN
ncbi:MAG: outer membrane lipoprotein LolB [Pseudomonadales bacterium]|nr:outer membrane lipoprotein LolB [Pseudomonadales bacterium]